MNFVGRSKGRNATYAETNSGTTSQHCIHELFEAQAARTPDAVAVTYGQDALTYAQLNQRANQPVHFLRKRGAGPEILVAMYMERSLDMVIALLAILKAGQPMCPWIPRIHRTGSRSCSTTQSRFFY